MFTRTRWLSILTGLLAAIGVNVASADLIYDSGVSTNGTGFGTQFNILTLHNSGGAGNASDIEQGTVGFDGTNRTCIGIDVVCDPLGKTNVFSFAELALDTAAQIILIWNPNEVGSSVETQVDQAMLTVFNPDGSSLFTASLAAPVPFATINHNGVGGEGFAFRLDALETAELQALLTPLTPAARGALIIGFESSVSFVDNGPDTWTIRSLCPAGTTCAPPPCPDCVPTQQDVPEPQSLLLLAIGLLGLTVARRGASVSKKSGLAS